MKFVSVHSERHTPVLWSGIPNSIVQGLRALGHEVFIVDDLQPRKALWSSAKRVIYRHLFNKSYDQNRDPAFIRKRTSGLRRRLAALGPVDGVLFTALQDAAYAETSSPVFLIHDAAWVSLLGYYIPPQRLAAESLAGGLALDKLALERCTAAIFCTRWAVDTVIQRYGIPSEKVHTIAMGANHAPPRSEVTAGLASRGQGTMKLLFVGREWDRKGGDAALEICRQIERSGVPVEFTVVGCVPPGVLPPFVRTIPSLSRSVPDEKVTFDTLFRNTDFFLLPTRAEAFGLVFAEAAAFGVPVLTSDTGGVTGAVGPAWSFARPVDSPAGEFAAWAVENFRDRTAYERMAWAARDDFEQRLNWPVFCQKLVDLTVAHASALSPLSPERDPA